MYVYRYLQLQFLEIRGLRYILDKYCLLNKQEEPKMDKKDGSARKYSDTACGGCRKEGVERRT